MLRRAVRSRFLASRGLTPYELDGALLLGWLRAAWHEGRPWIIFDPVRWPRAGRGDGAPLAAGETTR
jgi:hypothetical protein